MKTSPHHALASPCKSCPYRRDVPSGVWAEEEYAKLAKYDGEIIEQFTKGATGLFLCHQQNNALCSGWLGCHGPDELLAMRLNFERVAPEAYAYKTDVPLFSSGAEAAAHGLKEIEKPSHNARRTINRLGKAQTRRS
jgi:hypothetical protein